MAKTMSGSGGFYKYRCKYFYTKSCQNWVYVNGEACMSCLAEGCDAEDADLEGPSSADVCIPFVRDGNYGYAMLSSDAFSMVDGLSGEPPEVKPPVGPLRRM